MKMLQNYRLKKRNDDDVQFEAARLCAVARLTRLLCWLLNDGGSATWRPANTATRL